MKENFWTKLKNPISVSAPMAGVTDVAFRYMLVEKGAPDVVFTEMISLAGVRIKGESEFASIMKFTARERPIVFQFFGSTPNEFTLCGMLAQKYDADGIDINTGCPDKGVEKQGAGASIIKSPALAQEIIVATKESARGIPVSIKTRIGYANANEMERWIQCLAETKPSAITIHGRTRAEKRKGMANWEKIKQAGIIIKSISPETKIIGNGDVKSKEDGERLVKTASIDGYMVGRALIGNPWFFAGRSVTKAEKIAAARDHLQAFRELLGDLSSTNVKTKGFDLMKKHFAGYINDFVGAKELRIKLMEAKSFNEAETILNALG